jgi:hypothetical protein
VLLPKFIGIGAPRCGTRWLAQCLSEHPQIALPSEEVYFFTTRRVVHSYWSRGLGWYSHLFEECVTREVRTWGEITPVYLFDDDTPGLMHQCVPGAKLVCCLRDQSERAYSWYRLFLRFNPDVYFTDFSFRQFLTYNPEVYGREGFYLEHLRRYLALFPRESILILLYDDLQQDAASYIQRVFRFLGVDASFVAPSLNKCINPMLLEIPRSRVLGQIAARLKNRQRSVNIGLLLDKLNTRQIHQADLSPRHQLDPEMRVKMAELYQEHNQRLGEFLDRDLGHWNKSNCEVDDGQ